MSQSKTQLTIRRATSADMPALLAFVEQTYGKGAPFKDAARHVWQFEDNPYRAQAETTPTIWLALDGPKVVGEIAVQDGRLWIGEDSVAAGWIVDVMVHPQYRGIGLSHQIHEAVTQERGVLVTLTMAAATRRVAERAGCLTLGPTRQFILPRHLSAKTVARFVSYRAHTSNPRRARLLEAFNATRVGPLVVAGLGRLAAAWRRPRRAVPLPKGCRIVEVARFEAGIDHLWQAHKAKLPVVFERSAQFLNWRFVDVPGLTYRRFVLEQDGTPRGYLITRLGVAQELPLGVIADVFAAPEDAEALDALYAHACQVLLPEAEYLEAAASTPAWQAALKRAGFIATRTMRATVVCRDPDLRARLAPFSEDWHFSKADHDWDQIHPV